MNSDAEKKPLLLSLALVHWPIYDRMKNIICTNVTNFDVHDIARVSTAYNLQNYFIVNRMKEQLMFVSRLLDHWRLGSGSKYNPMRKTALSRVVPVEYLKDAIAAIDPKPFVVATSAREIEGVPRMSFRDLRVRLETESQPTLLVFGTGFGLAPEVFEECDALL
ncbi:MAG: RNA methyltransferase, partial [Bdellovibrionales bacterium]|nr:RNA methyltransferase [Bdellovibrionales bacterium]